jgi:hypothetical protein
VAPVALAATGGHRSGRPLVVLGGLVLAAIVGVFAYMNMNSTSTNGGSGSGAITFTPSTISCSAILAADVPYVATLSFMPYDSGVRGAVAQQTIAQWQLDGATIDINNNPLFIGGSPSFFAMRDGSFQATGSLDLTDVCPNSYYPSRRLGTHTIRALDSNGKVLVQGSITLTP